MPSSSTMSRKDVSPTAEAIAALGAVIRAVSARPHNERRCPLLARENAAALTDFISLGESLALIVEFGDDAPRWPESRQGYRKSHDASHCGRASGKLFAIDEASVSFAHVRDT